MQQNLFSLEVNVTVTLLVPYSWLMSYVNISFLGLRQGVDLDPARGIFEINFFGAARLLLPSSYKTERA